MKVSKFSGVLNIMPFATLNGWYIYQSDEDSPTPDPHTAPAIV